MRAVAIVLAGLTGTGCALFCFETDCAAGPGAVVVRVVDAESGARLPEATVLADEDPVSHCSYDWDASGDAGPSNCWAIRDPGSYTITVRAPGYAETTLEVEADADVCGRVTAQERTVGLQRLGTRVQPVVQESETCGG